MLACAEYFLVGQAGLLAAKTASSVGLHGGAVSPDTFNSSEVAVGSSSGSSNMWLIVNTIGAASWSQGVA